MRFNLLVIAVLVVLFDISMLQAAPGTAPTVGEPRVVKSSGAGGMAPPAYIRVETCALYPDRVEITRRYGAMELKETRGIQVTNIKDAILVAQKEAVETKPNRLCDGPATSIYAESESGTSAQPLLLFETGGCGNPRQLRNGPQADNLRSLVNLYCPLTYDFIQ